MTAQWRRLQTGKRVAHLFVGDGRSVCGVAGRRGEASDPCESPAYMPACMLCIRHAPEFQVEASP